MERQMREDFHGGAGREVGTDFRRPIPRTGFPTLKRGANKRCDSGARRGMMQAAVAAGERRVTGFRRRALDGADAKAVCQWHSCRDWSSAGSDWRPGLELRRARMRIPL